MTALQIQEFAATITSENIDEYFELDESSLQIFVMGYGFSNTRLADVKRLNYVKTITLNGDGTVTLAIYVPRQN